jgi:FkbM family methyltransferase
MAEHRAAATLGNEAASQCIQCLEEEGVPPRAVDYCNSQFNQDLWMYHNLFKCMDGPGRYLDIGAHEPQKLSSTWLLDKCLNWEGICIEANPGLAASFAGKRSCTVVAKAISLKEGPVVLSDEGPEGTVLGSAGGGAGGGIATTSATLASVLQQAGWLTGGSVAEELTVDFVSLDVEGHELEALMSAPWDSLNIKALAIENRQATQDVHEFLQDKGYVLAATFAIDDFFLRLPQRSPFRSPFLEPGRSHLLRKTTAIVRRDSLGAVTYQHKALFQGWPYVLEAAEKKKEIPEA